jgi:hypothetical protein
MPAAIGDAFTSRGCGRLVTFPEISCRSPAKGWFIIVRLYGPLEPLFIQTWKPGEIEPI